MKTKDIHWLAGLLEGEGWFSWSGNTYRNNGVFVRYPQVGLGSTDLDVITRAKNIMNPKLTLSKQSPTKNPKVKTQKQCYTMRIGGNKAIQWMMTLLPLMGERRQSRIKEIIQAWKDSPGNSGIYTTT